MVDALDGFTQEAAEAQDLQALAGGQARRLGDEVLFLHQGRLVERAPVARFFRQPDSAEAAAFIKGELPWV